MTEKFILWAQALDNVSPDHFDDRGEELSADASARRQDVVSLVSSVIKSGTRVYEVSGVLLTADNFHFVLEVPSAQRDNVGRTAPIICYGDYDAAIEDELGDSAVVALGAFVKRIGRTLQTEHINLVRDSFDSLKKKSSIVRLLRTVGIGAVILVLLVLVYELVQRS